MLICIAAVVLFAVRLIMRVVKSLVKLSIAGGALYYTVESGLCKNQEESLKAYNSLLNSLPSVKEYVNKVPSLNDSKQDIINYWNSGVKISFSALASLPTYSKDGCRKGYEYVVESIKSQTAKKS